MWRNLRCLHMTDVEKYEIFHIWHVCDVENVAKYAKFIAIYAVLLLNLLFMLFCSEIPCGEKLSPKVHLWRKNDKYQLCYHILCPHCLVDTDMNKLHFSILKFDPPQPLNSNPKTYFDFKGRMFKSCSTPWKPTHSPESLTFQEAAASTILALWSLCRHCDIFIRIQISQWLRT